jgi:hypothetical protein
MCRSYVSQRLAEMPMLMVGTYRPSDSDVSPSLAQMLEDLVRGRMATQLRLGGLSADNVAAMLKNMGGQTPPHGLS